MTTSHWTIESHRVNVVLWGLLVSAATLLRILLALHPGLGWDEIFSLAMATGHSLEHPANAAKPALGDYVEPPDPTPPSVFRRYLEHDELPAGPSRVIRAVVLSDTSPPLYYLLLNVWSRLLGTKDAALRLFSAVWGLACFPLLWSIGIDLGGRRTAWAACVFFAFSPLALYYSAEGRMYSLVWFLALVLAWSTLALAGRGPRSYLLLAWVFSAASGLLTHYFFAFVLMACLSWLLLHPTKLSRLHLTGLVLVTALTVLPWYIQVPEIMKQWRVTGMWAAEPLTWKEVFLNPCHLAWSYVSVAGVWGGSRRENMLAAALYAVIALVIVRQGVRRFLSERPRLLWLWALGAVVGPAVVDLVTHGSRSLTVRYALPGFPAAILLMAVGAGNLSRNVYVASLIFLPLIWLPATRKVFAEPSRIFEPFPQVSTLLDTWAELRDLIIAHSIPSGVLGLARYMGTDTPIVSWVVQLKQHSAAQDMPRFASSYERVAVVKIHDLEEPSPAEDWLLQNETLESRKKLCSAKAEVLFFGRELR